MKKEAELVQSVKRAMELLEVISSEKEIGIRELSRLTGLSRGSVQRLVFTLEEGGFLTQNQINKKYHLSFKLFQLGHQALLQSDLRSVARPILEKLMVELHETVVLATMDNEDIIYVDKIAYPHEIQLTSTIGSAVPAHCVGTGKAILAYLPEAERLEKLHQKQLVSFTKNTITDIKELEQEFAAIRDRGFAIDREERFPGVTSVAAPIRDYSGKVVGAIGVPGFTNRITEQRIPELGEKVLIATEKISIHLGYNKNQQNVCIP